MRILIYIIFALILAFFTSKLKINIISLRKYKNTFKIDFNIKFELYLFGFLRITICNIKQDGIHFLFFVIPYPKMKFDKKSVEFIKDSAILDTIKGFDVRLEMLKLNANIGTANPILVSFLVCAISSYLSFFIAKYRNKINYKKVFYKINPVYNINLLEFDITGKISLKLQNFVKIIYIMQKNKKVKKLKPKHFKSLKNRCENMYVN